MHSTHNHADGDMQTEIQITVRSPVALPVEIIRQQSFAGLRVLIIEDDMLIGMLFAETLVDMGHAVCAIAVNEEDAVFAAREHMPDLMIVDARLGLGSGIAAVAKIISRSYVPHVFVTGDKPGVVKLRPNAVVIEKPFLVVELEAAIRRAMIVA
jgi:two-component system, response regulator PdtaR